MPVSNTTVEVTDTSGNNAAVKPASTPAAAADPALVVALSPNSPLPAGTNALGSVTVTGSPAISGTVTANQGTPNTTANSWPTSITDGTHGPAAVKAASTAAVATDPALVVAVSPNNSVAVTAASLPLPTGAATSANQTTLGSQTTKINDGTNTAAVKAASTAAVATDPSLVVALSPNSPIPTGANVIGAVTQSGGPWTVSQATASNLNATAAQGAPATLANAWSTKITDATNGPVAVKPASTAAVAADPALVVAISPNNSISTSTPDVTATGALGALNAAVSVATAGLDTCGFQLAAGTLIGTIVPEVSFDGGTTWNPTYFDTAASGKVNSIVFASSNTATAATIVGVGGSGNSRVRVSAYTSGTANITVRATTRDDPSVLFASSPNTTTQPPSAAQIAGWDGTTLRVPSVKAASTAAVAADPALVVAVSPNNSVAVTAASLPLPTGAATSANQTTLGSQTTKINDGTNTAAVKAASTAAAATDPSLVVALSPNSHAKATIQPLYGANNQALTITIASLTNGSARASTAVVNTTNLFEDVLIFVKITTAAAGTSANGYVNIFGYGSVDGGTTYSESITGTDAAVTLTVPPNLVLIAQVNTVANGVTYRAGPFSFCRNYGLDRLPTNWGIVVQNQSGATLNATAGNQAITYQGVNGQLG